MGQANCLALQQLGDRDDTDVLLAADTSDSSSLRARSSAEQRLMVHRRPRSKGPGTGQWLKSVIQTHHMCEAGLSLWFRVGDEFVGVARCAL